MVKEALGSSIVYGPWSEAEERIVVSTEYRIVEIALMLHRPLMATRERRATLLKRRRQQAA